MEHRYDPRIKIQDRVLVHVNRSTFFSGVTQNISYGGLALNSAQIQCLKRHAMVSVVLKLNGRLVFLPSQVVRVNGNEAALMFIQHASNAKKRLSAWLNMSRSGHACQNSAELGTLPA